MTMDRHVTREATNLAAVVTCRPEFNTGVTAGSAFYFISPFHTSIQYLNPKGAYGKVTGGLG